MRITQYRDKMQDLVTWMQDALNKDANSETRMIYEKEIRDLVQYGNELLYLCAKLGVEGYEKEPEPPEQMYDILKDLKEYDL